MSKHDKLLEKFLSKAKDSTYSELKTLLGGFGYEEDKKGKISGSKVQFINYEDDNVIVAHKPHPKPILKTYMINQIIEKLAEYGDI